MGTNFIRQARAALPEPGTNPISRLRHTVAVFAETGENDWAVRATTNLYGGGIVTGLTHGDLRALLAAVDQAREDGEAVAPEIV